jgi:hypothetical protein
MSRSGGVEAHSHVGDGHDAVVGIGICNLVDIDEKTRRAVVRRASRMLGACAREMRANANDMVCEGDTRRGKLGKLYAASEGFRSHDDDTRSRHNGARSIGDHCLLGQHLQKSVIEG